LEGKTLRGTNLDYDCYPLHARYLGSKCGDHYECCDEDDSRSSQSNCTRIGKFV